jgi:hypothetical protein
MSVSLSSRTNQLLDARQQLIKQRRETSIRTKKQKDDLNRLMESVRTDASKANKIINMAMKGNLSLKSIISTTGGERSSTGGRKKKKGGGMNSRSLNSTSSDERGGTTRSAGDYHTSGFSHGNQTNGVGGGGGYDDSMKYELQENTIEDPLPYISPYELNSGSQQNKKASQKITL